MPPEMSDTTFVTVTPRAEGGLVHVTSLSEASKTACKKDASGWRIAVGHITCSACKQALMPKKRKKA